MAEGPLGAGEDRVVVAQHGAGASLAEEVAVDTRRAGHEAVGGGALDQLLHLAPPALGGDRKAAVLDEGAGVDEVLDVLACGSTAGLVAAPNRVSTRLVLGQLAAGEQLRQVVALVPSAGHLVVGQAGEPGFEPGFTVLETVRIAVNSLPRGAQQSEILVAPRRAPIDHTHV